MSRYYVEGVVGTCPHPSCAALATHRVRDGQTGPIGLWCRKHADTKAAELNRKHEESR